MSENNKAEVEKETKPKTGMERLVAFFAQPTIFIAVITGLVVPITVQIVTNKMEEAKIKQQIVTSLMDVVKEGIDVEDSAGLDKLYLITSLVEDNEFGLSFPSAQEIINERKELEKAKLDDELTALREELATNRLAVKNEREDMEKARAEYEEEINNYAEQVRVLSANDSTMEEKISALQNANATLQTRVENSSAEAMAARQKLENARSEINSLSEFKKSIVTEDLSIIEKNEKSFQDIVIRIDHVGGIAKNINLKISLKDGSQSISYSSVSFESIIGAKFNDAIYVVYFKPFVDNKHADMKVFKFPETL